MSAPGRPKGEFRSAKHEGVQVIAPGRARALVPQRGASMIEVLVAILIVSLGILALAGLLGVSSRLGKTSEFRSVATLLAADMADRMRANRPGADEGSYGLVSTALASDPPSEAACALATACTEEELATADLAEWQTSLLNGLPSGTGYIAYTSQSGVADMWVMWQDPKALTEDDNSDNALIEAGIANRCPPGFDTESKPSCMYFRIGL